MVVPLDDVLVDVYSTNPKGKASLNVANNKIMTDIKDELYDSWLRFENDIKTYSEGNSHNGEALKKVNTTGSKVALSDILSEANHIVKRTKEDMCITILRTFIHQEWKNIIQRQGFCKLLKS